MDHDHDPHSSVNHTMVSSTKVYYPLLSCMASRVFSDSLGLKVDRWTVFKQYPMLLGPLEKFINGRHVIECDLSPSRGIDFLSFQS